MVMIPFRRQVENNFKPIAPERALEGPKLQARNGGIFNLKIITMNLKLNSNMPPDEVVLCDAKGDCIGASKQVFNAV